MSKTIDVIIPVYKPGKEFFRLLARLQKQTVVPEHIILIQTMEEGDALLSLDSERITVYPIEKEAFDHGKTRADGARLSDADYIVFMTQDAMPADPYVMENLLEGFEAGKVGVSYARQIARKDANLTERLTRLYNYPEKSRLKTKADLEKLGIKTYFCSDVCAMYDRVVYEKLGGFSYPTIFNEDMIMASKMVQAGYGVYYAGHARVIHSHSYTCLQQFSRSFDLGVSQRQYREVFEGIFSEREGVGFAKKTLVTLYKCRRFWQAFYFAWQCAFRLVGYQLGKHYDMLPEAVILRCTMNREYWNRKEGE